MATTIKRINVRLTKGDVMQLADLVSHYGETNSEIITRAITVLHHMIFTAKIEDKKQ
jgi:hypothetical protein